MSSSFFPSPPASPHHSSPHHPSPHQQSPHHQKQNNHHQNIPPIERKEPFRTLIKPFLKRGTSTTFDSIKDHLKLSSSAHHKQHSIENPLNPASEPQPTSSSVSPRSLPCSTKLLSSNLNSRQSHPNCSESSSSKSSSIHQQQPQSLSSRHKISRARQAASLKLHALSSLSSKSSTNQPPSNSKTNSPSTHPSSLNDSVSNQHQPRPLNDLIYSSYPNSPLTPSSTRPLNSIVSITSSIHSLLTQPALVTLAQLAPAQLLSGVHSSCFGSSDAFRIFDAHLPTTIEQLSASSIALPITSISSIWRLLNSVTRTQLTPPP
ncbi:hypothetical protein VP01_2350g2 [Puccinia sorghi]|uniref:Uncharacterized protein n=1 Tax=Puccinia sorghi TaxID=27349 RepID=A0A0L6V7G1_9BASI|nr:hypothetical protein VP01_2350g2 [Puccinia sorghi]